MAMSRTPNELAGAKAVTLLAAAKKATTAVVYFMVLFLFDFVLIWMLDGGVVVI